MLTTTYISLIDPPRVLQRGQVIDGERFVIQSSIYGRVIFTAQCALVCLGDNVVQNCSFVHI